MTDAAPVSSPTASAVIGSGRRTRWPLWGAMVLVLLAALAWWFTRGQAGEGRLQYQTSPATTGALVVSVSATGNLQPTNKVDVGSELSGIVEAVTVQVNDRVRKGQVLASLDPAKLQDTVARSQAALAQAEAQVQQAQATVKETRASLARLREVHQLSGGQVPAATELASAEASLDRAVASEASTRASVQQAQATLRSDRTNLAKAQIRSPIDGVVLARKVEPGQTVAASLQAPTLFTLAENLAQMQLEVNVDEADVGQVKAGQLAQFSVDAYPDRRYPAVIQRVGLGSQTSNNVVSYLTVLKVDNADLSLRPGMTATADITTLSVDGALLVPNAALRWSPPAAPAAAASRSIVSSLIPRMPGGGSRQAGNAARPKRGVQQRVWVLGADGQPQAVAVMVGASDGRLTQITGGALQAGQAVITDSTPARP
jgi:HlyD family secretion protein